MVVPKIRPWTQDEIVTTFNYDNGILYWKTGPRKGERAGWQDNDNYILIRYKNYLVRSHNVVWLYFYGVWPTFELDHINNVPHDNAIDNLRPAIRREQCANQRLQTRRTGKYKGVHQSSSGNYYVKIKHLGKQFYLGTYTNEKDAALAYNEKAIELFGDFTCLN